MPETWEPPSAKEREGKSKRKSRAETSDKSSAGWGDLRTLAQNGRKCYFFSTIPNQPEIEFLSATLRSMQTKRAVLEYFSKRVCGLNLIASGPILTSRLSVVPDHCGTAVLHSCAPLRSLVRSLANSFALELVGQSITLVKFSKRLGDGKGGYMELSIICLLPNLLYFLT